MPELGLVMITQGEILERLGHWGEAAATYARAMEDGLGGDQAVYQYARSLRKSGGSADRQKAHALLEKLAGNGSASTDGFWRRLAREALADEKSVPQ
jgi:hypothetical protein